MRLLVAAALALALTAAPAAARHRMPGPPGAVSVHHGHGPCPSHATECVNEDGAIYMTGRDRFTFAHARGHVFDQRVLTDQDRAELTVLLGFQPGTPWQSGDVRDSPISAGPIEYFADAYAACDLGLRPGWHRHGRALVSDWTSSTDYMPTARQQRRVCFTIRFLGWYRRTAD